MVTLSLSQLKGIEERMLSQCEGADVEIIIDCRERAVYLRWRGAIPATEKEYALSKKIRFVDIDQAIPDVLKLEATHGSHEFIAEVNYYSGNFEPKKIERSL